MPDVPDPAEFLDVQVQQLPRPRPFIADEDGRGVSASRRANPNWAKVRATVARLTCTTSAICAPVQPSWRSRWISTMTAAEMARGQRRGRHERSARSPMAARWPHLRAVR
jgi:hypothetical protein